MSGLRAFALAFVVTVLVGMAFVGGYVLGDQRGQQAAVEQGDLGTFWRVRDLLQTEFLGDQPVAQAQAYGAAHGLVSSYKDPYTVFVEPGPRTLERDDLRGQFGGIGAYIKRGEAGEVILSPMKDSPAIQAGVIDGDILVSVEGKTLEPEITNDAVIVLIRGEIGTSVRLGLRRQGQTDLVHVSVTRQRIETPSIEWRMLDQEAGIGYLRITIFTERTGREILTGLQELTATGARRLILDLRGNGGGLVDSAVDTTSVFLSQGSVLREDRRGGEVKLYPVKATNSPAQAWPLVIVVDGGTASVSEIVAGALRDQGRAVLVGEKTYGKGSVQSVHELPDGSSLHVTTARWYTPNGNQIDKTGLQPDYRVPVTAEDRSSGTDPQLERALAVIRSS